MRSDVTQPTATLWMVDDLPSRMVFAGQRWRVTDMPTRLRDSIWSSLGKQPSGLYGWRFQAESEDGTVRVFDVFKEQDGWHVHHTWE